MTESLPISLNPAPIIKLRSLPSETRAPVGIPAECVNCPRLLHTPKATKDYKYVCGAAWILNRSNPNFRILHQPNDYDWYGDIEPNPLRRAVNKALRLFSVESPGRIWPDNCPQGNIFGRYVHNLPGVVRWVNHVQASKNVKISKQKK
ncbi:MAG: hypothetical protein U0525_00750 [Patescibacteria group bacterium]